MCLFRKQILSKKIHIFQKKADIIYPVPDNPAKQTNKQAPKGKQTMKNLTPLTDGQRADLKKSLLARLETRATRTDNLAALNLSPAEVSSAAETFAPDAPAEEVWALYKEVLPIAIDAALKTRTRTEELERLELDEASADDPRLAETPADPKPLTMKRLMERLTEKRDKARKMRDDRMIVCGEEGRDIKEDEVLNAINDAIAGLENAVAQLTSIAGDAEWLATDGGQEGW